MTITDQVQTARDTDRVEAEVTAVIEACGGDPRNAIRALLVEQEILEQRISRLAGALSFGYVRGRTDIAPDIPPDLLIRSTGPFTCGMVIRGGPGT